MEASPKSAAIAGAWSVLGLVPFDAWIEQHANMRTPLQAALWVVLLGVFFVVPF